MGTKRRLSRLGDKPAKLAEPSKRARRAASDAAIAASAGGARPRGSAQGRSKRPSLLTRALGDEASSDDDADAGEDGKGAAALDAAALDDDVRIPEHDAALDDDGDAGADAEAEREFRDGHDLLRRPHLDSDSEGEDDDELDAADGALEDDVDAEAHMKLVEALRGEPDGAENKLTNLQVQSIIVTMKAWWSALPPAGRTLTQHIATRWGACKDGRLVVDKLGPPLELTPQDLRFVFNREMYKRLRLEYLLRSRGMLELANGAGSGSGMRSGPSSASGGPGGAGSGGAPAVEDVAGSACAADLATIQECVARGYTLMLAELQMRKALDPSLFAGCPTLTDPLGYVPYTQAKLNEYQTLIVYLLRNLHEMRYRRYNGAVYEQVLSPMTTGYDGRLGRYPTHAWKRVCDIKDFVLRHTNKEDAFSQWQTMTAANNRDKAVSYLTDCVDAEFAQLYPDRMWHAFNNGLYHVDSLRFFKYGDPRIPSHVVACKFHEQDFDESIIRPDWYNIKVQHLESVLEYQFQVSGKPDGIKDEEEKSYIIMWIYAFLGRLLYEVNTKDKWQVILFVVGRAGTGKSLLLKSAGHFFQEEDVEVLANNSQRGFGLETLVDKKMWMCFEVKHDFSLDQAQLQSMISGEPLSIQRKHKMAMSVVWAVPGMLAGNESAAWVDNSGSMSRRVVMATFDYKVKADKVDPHLDSKIKANIGALLHKSACAYHFAVNEFGSKDIWGTFVDGETGKTRLILPEYFHKAKNRFQVSSDPLYAFIKNDPSITLTDKSEGIAFDRLKALADRYFQQNGHKGFQWRTEKYKSVFDDQGIEKIVLDEKFIESRHGPGARKLVVNGCEYAIGTHWLLGITENCEATGGAGAGGGNVSGGGRSGDRARAGGGAGAGAGGSAPSAAAVAAAVGAETDGDAAASPVVAASASGGVEASAFDDVEADF